MKWKGYGIKGERAMQRKTHPGLAAGDNDSVHEAAVVENPLVGTAAGVLLLLLLFNLGGLTPDLTGTRERSVNLALWTKGNGFFF